MKHIGLFEGIGGFSLAAEWAGWETIAWCEINPFCQKVLGYHFPKANKHHDIKITDFTIYRGQCDILTGGFPCQPYSLAGKRKGKEDDRHLWPEMLRAVREIQPPWIVGENVFGIVNWDGGVVFNEVQTDLEAEGYEVQPYILPAGAVNAPHRRDRIWFVAYSGSNGHESGRLGKDRQAETKGIEQQKERERIWADAGRVSKSKTSANTQSTERPKPTHTRSGWNGIAGMDDVETTPNPNHNGQHRGNGKHEINTSKGGEYVQRNIEQMGGDAADTEIKGLQRGGVQDRFADTIHSDSTPRNWENFPTQPPVRGRNDGLPGELDGITFSKWRNESIKAYGNAIVPQVAYQIFKAINDMTNNSLTCSTIQLAK